MAHVQNRPNFHRRNGTNNNFPRRGHRSYSYQRQPLQDIDGNIIMSGMETVAASPAPFNRLNHRGPTSQGGRGRRRNRNRNRNRNRHNGQTVKLDMSPVTVHAKPDVPSHAHPQMLTQLDDPFLQGQAELEGLVEEAHQYTALPVASAPAPNYSWSSPIKYVHMNGELTPVDNCGDVVMGEAPSLLTSYSRGCAANEHMLIIALSNEMGNLQLPQ